MITTPIGKLALLMAIGAFFCPAAGLAQVSPPAAAVGALVQQAIAAHGSGWTRGQVQDWIAQGKLTYFNGNGAQATFNVTLTRKGSGKVQRVVKQALDVRTGTDGKSTWDSLAGMFIMKAQGTPLNFIESQTVRSVQALLNYQASGLALTDKGVNGNAHVIQAADSSGRATSFFIDTGTSLITRLEFVTGQGRDAISGNTVNKTDAYVFSNYQAVQGLLTPFKIERYSTGVKTEEIDFTSVQYNASVTDDVFKP